MTEAQKLLDSLSKYMALHPEERFWQALRNWSGESFVIVSSNFMDEGIELIGEIDLRDTFYWKTKNK